MRRWTGKRGDGKRTGKGEGGQILRGIVTKDSIPSLRAKAGELTSELVQSVAVK